MGNQELQFATLASKTGQPMGFLDNDEIQGFPVIQG